MGPPPPIAAIGKIPLGDGGLWGRWVVGTVGCGDGGANVRVSALSQRGETTEAVQKRGRRKDRGQPCPRLLGGWSIAPLFQPPRERFRGHDFQVSEIDGDPHAGDCGAGEHRARRNELPVTDVDLDNIVSKST